MAIDLTQPNQRGVLFSKGLPTNRIPVTIPSTGRTVVMRETTVTELKSIAKTIIDNFNRRQMDVIYDAVTEYLQAMFLTDDVDVSKFTDLDRLYCLMVFFQVSFFRDSVQFKCPKCGVEINYRYDLFKYIVKIPDSYVDEQVVDIPFKGHRTYRFRIAWPTTHDISIMYRHFYNEMGEVTEQMEQTQLGIHYILSFIKGVDMVNEMSGQVEASVQMGELDEFRDRLDCLNALPSMVMFDEDNGLFSKITGYFVNRLENCFSSEHCPQCGAETEYGIPSSNVFYSMFYGMMRSIYGFVVQVECLCIWKYGASIFNEESNMTYNDLQSLVKQLQTTEEKDAEEKRKVGKDNFTKGLWYIREILNCMIFPGDRRKGSS